VSDPTGTTAADRSASEDTVLAAGAVLWRPGPNGRPEVALVHRPKYDDWSLPKGKLLPGEHPVVAAVREVREETGFGAVLGVPLPTQRYLALGRPKQVDYWAARALDGRFTPTDEVDAFAWVTAPEAPQRLTHPRDGDLVAGFAANAGDTWALIVLRHAKAFPRSSWKGDDLDRPLNERGHDQAARLRSLLAAYGIRRVITSPARRCRDSVAPYAEEAGLPVEEAEYLTEEGYPSDGHASFELVESLLAAAEPVVVCTHRPVLPGFAAMVCAASGDKTQPPRSKLKPGAFWVLHLSGRRVVAVEEHSPEPSSPSR
jgi:phosphohistidine phosphatase SixA/8-oxo-dGTP pyrophosphatase MutT (NUDIX family)